MFGLKVFFIVMMSWALANCQRDGINSDSGFSSKDIDAFRRNPLIKRSNMSREMQQDAVNTALRALEKSFTQKGVAAFIKKEFDRKYNPAWNVIVGRNAGSYITPQTRQYIEFAIGVIAMVIFKV